jgi:hypothetical protein
MAEGCLKAILQKRCQRSIFLNHLFFVRYPELKAVKEATLIQVTGGGDMKTYRIYIEMVIFFSLALVVMATPSMGGSASTMPGGTKGVVKDTSRQAVDKGLTMTMKAKKDSMLKALPQLSITSFKKSVPTGSLLAPSARGHSAASSASPSIELGDDIELYWSIRFRNVQTPQVTINGRRVTGEAHTASDGTPWMAGRVSFRPSDTTTYNLVATALPQSGGARAARVRQSLRVIVKKPVLTVLTPEVDQHAMTIKFFAQNTGDADFRATPVLVNYEIDGGRLARGRLTTPRMAITRNQRVELGEITLPDRRQALQNDSIRIRVTVGAYYVQPLREARGDFTHNWTPETVRIDNAMLRLLGMATICEIVIDNWDDAAGSNRWINTPYQENACRVDFSVAEHGSPFQFDLPYFDQEQTGGPLGIIYRTFLRNIRAYHRGDRDLFSVNDGKLQIALDFPGRDSREIKIGRVGRTGSRRGKWKDDAVPDVNLSAFTVTIQLTPGVSGGELTYTDVDVAISGLRADFPGGWSWLNAGFQGYATRMVRRTLDDALTHVLTSSSIKSAIIDGINSGIGASGVDITRISSLRGSGDTIAVDYF